MGALGDDIAPVGFYAPILFLASYTKVIAIFETLARFNCNESLGLEKNL
jgi:hypothetical protein